jgi:hypothetical protein
MRLGDDMTVPVREKFIASWRLSVLVFERAEETTADLRNSKRTAKNYLLHDLKDGSVARSELFLNLKFAYRRPERSAKVSDKGVSVTFIRF